MCKEPETQGPDELSLFDLRVPGDDTSPEDSHNEMRTQ